MALHEYFESVDPRGSIDQMLRTLQQKQLYLSSIADQKASILIGASFVVVTILFGQLSTGGFTPTLLALSVTTLAAGALATISLIPRISVMGGAPTIRKDPNLLFFVDAAEIDLETYSQQMALTLEADARLYASIVRDVHESARVLQYKYRFVTYSYQVFLGGVLITFLTLFIP